MRIKRLLTTVEESDPRPLTYTAKLLHEARYLEVIAVIRKYVGGEIGTLIDVGCGRGFLYEWLVKAGIRVGYYVGGDMDSARLKEVRGERVLCDAHHLPLRERLADCVLCSEVLEHVERPLVAFFEQLKVSKSWLMVTFPREDLKNALGFRYPEHISEVRLDELEALARRKSFRLLVSRKLHFPVPPSVLDRFFKFSWDRLRLFSTAFNILSKFLGPACLIEDHVLLFNTPSDGAEA